MAHAMANMANFILQFLNDEPFNLHLSSIQFDSLQPQQLLQLASNVLCWVFDQDQIDIKREAAEETAFRLLNSLRILRFRAPQDPEEQEDWRAGIVEGQKQCLYPLLVFLFENADALKERAYLAKYLMKTDIPMEFYDYDVEELQNEIAELMLEFKETHADVKSIMADVLLLDDIKEDLKSMEKEQQVLVRKIEKTEKKVQTIPYFDKQMQLAAQLREEKNRFAEYMHQKQLERQKVLNVESRINRMGINLNEAQAFADSLDEQALAMKWEDERATNQYLVERLFHDKELKENRLREYLNMTKANKVTDDDIRRMNEDIEEMHKRIRKLEDERTHKEVDVDDNMSVFRHRVTFLEAKKTAEVLKLQEARQELAKILNDVEERRTNLKDVMGGEVVSNVQYRAHLDQYRKKSEDQKRKRKEAELIFNEKTVLTNTVEILSKRYKELESHIESIGGEIVEVLNVPSIPERPKTSAPQTNNAEAIKSNMKDMMERLDERKDRITDQRGRRDELKIEMEGNMEELKQVKQQKAQQMAELEQTNRAVIERVKELENIIEECNERIPELQQELADLLNDKNTMEGIADDHLDEKVNIATEKENELDELVGDIDENSDEQYQGEIWRELCSIFEIKVQLADQYGVYNY